MATGSGLQRSGTGAVQPGVHSRSGVGTGAVSSEFEVLDWPVAYM